MIPLASACRRITARCARQAPLRKVHSTIVPLSVLQSLRFRYPVNLRINGLVTRNKCRVSVVCFGEFAYLDETRVQTPSNEKVSSQVQKNIKLYTSEMDLAHLPTAQKELELFIVQALISVKILVLDLKITLSKTL